MEALNTSTLVIPVIATASEARREAIQNVSEIYDLWIATSLRSSR
ncbi:hypothetical protein [Thiobacillus sp.]